MNTPLEWNSSEYDLCTEHLPIGKARDWLTGLERAAELAGWKPWSGSDGASVSTPTVVVKREDLLPDLLPAHATSMSLANWDSGLPLDAYRRVALIGGNSWTPPEFGDSARISHGFCPEQARHPTLMAFEIFSGGRFYGKPANQFCKIGFMTFNWFSIYGVNRAPEMDTMGWHTEPESYDIFAEIRDEMKAEILDSMRDREQIVDKRRVLNPAKPNQARMELMYPLEARFQLQDVYFNILERMIGKSSNPEFGRLAISNMGGTAKFHGETHDVTEPARELLALVAEHNDHPAYEFQYSYLGSRSWEARQKARKKGRYAVESLGVAVLKGGYEMQVKLNTLESGYSFLCSFPNHLAHEAFMETNLFKQIGQWHSGAE